MMISVVQMIEGRNASLVSYSLSLRMLPKFGSFKVQWDGASNAVDVAPREVIVDDLVVSLMVEKKKLLSRPHLPLLAPSWPK